MNEDWLYSQDRMELREKCLSVLLRKYGTNINGDGIPEHSTQSIYNCAHDWVSQGNPSTSGIVKYFEAYYT